MTLLTSSISERILAAVDESFDQQLEFTAELVSHPSLRTEELSAQKFLYDAMEVRGFTMDRWEIDPAQIRHHEGFSPVAVSYENVVNVVGTFEPGVNKGRSLILNGHVDVVPTGPEHTWVRSPWNAPVIDGWMYGRGSADMKAGLVANLFAYDAIRAAGLVPAATIYFQSVVEEECTGNGALSAFLRGYTADAVLIPEPEENMLVRANVGVVWFKVRVEGRPTHPREMSSGLNAIDGAYAVMRDLRGLQDRWNAEKRNHRHFETLQQPINFNFGKIQGGDWPSSVPAWCEFDVRVSFYPGISADTAWAGIEECLDASRQSAGMSGFTCEAERTGFYAEGYVLEAGTEAEGVLAASHEQAFGSALESFVTPGYLDGRVFSLYGAIPTLVYGPVSENIHAFDERVLVESVRNVTKTIALFIADWCGVE